MTAFPEDARHLTVTTLDELWGSGAALVVPLHGEPSCRLQLEPATGTITLVTDYETPEPDVAGLRNVRFDAFVSGDDAFAELSIRVENNVYGAYSLLATIADLLQIQRLPLAVAVAGGIARHQHILASRAALTTEQELGLFGELLFLEFLIAAIGPEAAAVAWQGPLSEEHDFTFGDVHVELKTTSGERRRHTIHGLGQLVPLPDVPLSLVSVQLTRSSPDGGRTLPQMVRAVRHNAGGHQVRIDAILNASGWQDDDADLYGSCWALRSRPRSYAVCGEFPAMTPERVSPVVPSFGLISDVSYRVDLTDLEHEPLAGPLGVFVEPKD
jgi:putative PD-(D/E)XK family protein DUF4420